MKEQAPQFIFARNMPVNTRLTWVAALAVIGIGLQLLLSVFLGWLFVLAAVLLGTPKGKSNEPATIGGYEWQNVTTDEFQEAKSLMEKTRNLRSSASLSKAAGCGTAAFVVAALAVFYSLGFDASGAPIDLALRPMAQGGSLGFPLIIDAVTLIAPLAFFGRVKAWEPPDLRMRLDQLTYISELIDSSPELEIQPSLLVGKTKNGSVPMDCRLMVKLKDSDKDFMGVQVQTTLNSVQGKKYPYTYCVLIAKPEFRLLVKARQVVEMPPSGGFSVGWLADTNAKKEAKFARYRGAIVEIKTEKDVEIAVVRQGTSGTGYKTSPDQAAAVFTAAHQLAREVLAVRA